MRLLLRSLRSCALTLAVVGMTGAVAEAAGDCRAKGLEQLRTSSPDGFAVYEKISNRDFFRSWINCDDAQFDLATAVHESIHFIAAETDRFPLAYGGEVARPHEASGFFPPTRIAGRFKPNEFVSTYLQRGKASSSTDFMYLLDELNAYSHDLKTAIDLKNLHRPDEEVAHRDGLAAMMAFVAVYAETAQASEPATWSDLRQPKVASAISQLWERAERVMASSCSVPEFGAEDKAYIQHFCSPQAQSALTPILGRAPVCPTACMQTRSIIQQASESAADDGEDDQPDQAAIHAAPSSAWTRQTSQPRSGWRGRRTSDATPRE